MKCPKCTSTWIIDSTTLDDDETQVRCLDCGWTGPATEILLPVYPLDPVPPKPKRKSPWRSIDDE